MGRAVADAAACRGDRRRPPRPSAAGRGRSASPPAPRAGRRRPVPRSPPRRASRRSAVGELEEGEVIALEVLRDGEAEGGGRLVAGRVQHLDQQVDIAVRLGPVPLAVVQPARPVGRRVQSGDRLPHAHARQSALAHLLRAMRRHPARGGGTAPARRAPARSRRSPNGRPSRRRSGCPSSGRNGPGGC